MRALVLIAAGACWPLSRLLAHSCVRNELFYGGEPCTAVRAYFSRSRLQGTPVSGTHEQPQYASGLPGLIVEHTQGQAKVEHTVLAFWAGKFLLYIV